MEFDSKKELYNFLNNFDFDSKKDTDMSSVYFLMEFNDNIKPIYFVPYSDTWFESPCCLHRYKMDDDKLLEYVKELYIPESFEEAYQYEQMFQINGWHYEIENFQCEHFIPEKSKIINVLSEKECLNWLINNWKFTGSN